MTFLFNSSNDLHLQTEPISVGCEAWIDVGRFCATEQPAHQAAKTSSSDTITESFTNLRRKFRKNSFDDIG